MSALRRHLHNEIVSVFRFVPQIAPHLALTALVGLGCASTGGGGAGASAEREAVARQGPFVVAEEIKYYSGALKFADLRRCAALAGDLDDRFKSHKQDSAVIVSAKARLAATSDSIARVFVAVNTRDSAAVNAYNAAVAVHRFSVDSLNREVARKNDALTTTFSAAMGVSEKCSDRGIKRGDFYKLSPEEREVLEPILTKRQVPAR